MNQTARVVTAWIACFAILLVALAPSISHALAAKRVSTQEWTEICTSTGVKQFKVVEDTGVKPSSTDKHDQHYEDCPFCRVHIDAIGPVPTPVLVGVVLDAPLTKPFLFYQAPRPLFAWAPPQSRAPPFHS